MINTEKDTTLKRRRIKRIIQEYRKVVSDFSLISSYDNNLKYSHQLFDEELRRLSKLFNIKIQKGGEYGCIWIDGYKFFSYNYNFDYDEMFQKTFIYKQSKSEFKEMFLKTDGDKEKAFQLMKDADNKRKYKKLYANYKDLQSLQKFWSRQELPKSYEQYQQEYTKYLRVYFDKHYDKKIYDFLTFKQWYIGNK